MEGAVDVLAELEILDDEMYQGKIANFVLGDRESNIIGDGYDFHDTSEWTPGDSFDSIDWRLTLAHWPEKIFKVNKPETKELPLVLAIDSSPSMLIRFAGDESKFRMMLRLIGVIGFSAVHSHDPVAVASFGHPARFFLPVRYGKGNIFYAAEILLEDSQSFYKVIRQSNKKLSKFYSGVVDINECLSEILDRMMSQSVVVVISDFIDNIYGRLKLDEIILQSIVARHKDNVIFLILDEEHDFSWSGGSGTIMSKNISTGKFQEVRASDAPRIRAEYAKKRSEFQNYLEDQGIDSLVLSSTDWHDKLSEFAAGRERS